MGAQAVTPSPESEWREWYRRAHDVDHGIEHAAASLAGYRAARQSAPVGHTQVAHDLLVSATRFAIQDEARAKIDEAIERLAAAQRRDELTALERAVCDDAMARHKTIFSGQPEMLASANAALALSCIALRAARQPAPVDHLQLAKDALDEAAQIPFGSSKIGVYWNKINDHITAELAAREAK